MKSSGTAFFILILTAATALAADDSLKTPKDKLSYSIGMDIGGSLKQQAIDIDPEILARGFQDVMKGDKTLLTRDEAVQVITAFQQEMRAKIEAAKKTEGEKNKKEGEAFLAANKKKKGVKTTASGLQYKVIKEGTGAKPKATETVSTNYKGTLIDGKEFDSSYKRGQPVSFPVNGVIAGWTEALQMMKVGSKWELVIPANLAYGERGTGENIGPNATLVFEVELLGIEAEKK
ncbi:MAG TPA: FKBP-type peptidyl-prolyl cis-trans isomerase [Nitrospiria bacterium]